LDESGTFKFASERVLGFGMTASSNIAQRFATAVCHVVAAWMDADDAQFFAHVRTHCTPAHRAWLAARDALAAATGRIQTRLFSLTMFTDDSRGDAVGSPHMLRLLTHWGAVCSEFGIIRAAANKRQLGQWIISLGVAFALALGDARGAGVGVASGSTSASASCVSPPACLARVGVLQWAGGTPGPTSTTRQHQHQAPPTVRRRH
jgi:hypothetical protein